MLTFAALLRKIGSLDTDKIIDQAIDNTLEVISDKNKEQLLAGKSKQGIDIFPSYLDDPYFKSKESAQRYSDWKDRITPNKERKSGTPNLFIDGTYHKSRTLKRDGDVLQFGATFLGQEIEAKYGNQIDGLGGHFKKEYQDESLRPALNSLITNATGLKFGK